MNARKEADLVNPETGEFLELDIFVPSLKLAFEFQVDYNKHLPLVVSRSQFFQERHHYTHTEYTHKPVESITERDTIKRDLAKTKEITLISIPFWWDGHNER